MQHIDDIVGNKMIFAKMFIKLKIQLQFSTQVAVKYLYELA